MADAPSNPPRPPGESGEGGSSPPPPPVDPAPASDESLLIAGALRQARRGSDSPDPAERLPAPNTFPGYELIREIHRGGQGVVYLAIQKATKRKVAVKVLHQGPFAGDKDRQRFEREVEILAQLNHPNIVAVIDSGSTAPLVTLEDGSRVPSSTGERPAGVRAQAPGYQGSFYCVMEYISGSTLDAWVKEKQPGIQEVLRVFVQICDAVNAAHLKGIIHRDLKPANIRVDHDNKPHVLDFGLARVGIGSTTDGDTPELMTMTGQFIGSLPWASPEQAEGAPEKLDVRTDVYSLGVMLYQMLTDRFPYQVIGTMRDVLDNILRAEPARPSTVRRQINDEVETIVLKCLSKERERRYQNAGDLGRDLGRYLAGEPIEAKRDSGWYIITKTARRYKVAVGVGTAFLVLIIGFGIAMAALYNRAERQRQREVQARDAADEATARTVAALEDSQTERAKSDAVRAFLENMLASIDPDHAGEHPAGRDVTVAQMLQVSAAKIDTEFAGQEEVQAAVKHTIGTTYLGLGMPAEAEPFLRSAYDTRRRLLGEDADDTILTQLRLAQSIAKQRRYEEAREIYTQHIAALQHLGREDDERPWAATVDYAEFLSSSSRRDEALRQVQAGIEGIRTLSTPHPDLLGRALMLKANMLLGVGTPQAVDEAAAAAEEGVSALEGSLGPADADTGKMLVLLGRVRYFQGRQEESEALTRQGLDVLVTTLPETHPDRLNAEAWWAELLHRTDRLREAETIYRSIVDRWTRSTGAESLDTAWARAMLGSNLNRQQRWDEAEPELLFALSIYRREVGDAHERTRLIAAKIAQMFRESGHPERARELPATLR